MILWTYFEAFWKQTCKDKASKWLCPIQQGLRYSFVLCLPFFLRAALCNLDASLKLYIW